MQAGENPEDSARRELREEAGITEVTLRPLGASLFEDQTTRCFEHCFEVTWEHRAVSHPDAEMAWGAWVTLERLDALLATPGWLFVPDTRQLLTRLASEGVGDYATLASLISGESAT